MDNQKKLPGQDAEIRIYTCSGGSSVGEIADLAARKLYREGVLVFDCAVSVSAKIDNALTRTKKASRVIALDGCEKDCVGKTLKNARFKNITHVRLNELGMSKGETKVNDAAVDKVVQHIKEVLKKEK